MTLLRRAGRLARNPTEGVLTIQGKLAPDSLWARYASSCRRAGLARGRVLLSLDCDTTRDIEVVGDVHRRLVDVGVTPAYAVPGALLRKGSDTYAAIASQGAEFLNHGFAEHTRLHERTRTYESFFFYDELPTDVVIDDIRAGDASIREVVGAAPTGFRTPHFGSFQKPAHLRLLYRTLGELGYTYSTSTSPVHAYRHGPWRQVGPLTEIPVSGCPSWPLGILDTFGFRFAPGRQVDESDYVVQVRGLQRMLDEGKPIVVNLYGDPSQVEDWPEFFDAMAGLAPYAVRSFADLIAKETP